MMKQISKSIVASLLAILARGIIRKYKPTVVMITGSVGKTSTKDAVAAALTPKFFLRASEKSYNSEFGVPLTIIGSKNPWNNPIKWIRVFEEAILLLLLPNHYPKLLVLEVGADRPGDLKRILKIATPDAVVVTSLPSVPVHVEAYASPQAVREEEFTPATALKPDAPLIVSHDDGFAYDLAKGLDAHITTFGFTDTADICIENPEPFIEGNRYAGMKANVTVGGETYKLVVRGALGRPQLYAPSAALGLALSLGMTAEEAFKGLESYVPPPGRLRILQGKNGSTILDDSYNASPSAVKESLDALKLTKDSSMFAVPAKRTIAVLGDMLELGRYSVDEHEQVGALARTSADLVCSVGIRSKAILSSAQESGMKEKNTCAYQDANEAGRELATTVKEGDVVLIKGSQSMRMERVVRALLQNPEDQSKLVRQEKEWMLIK